MQPTSSEKEPVAPGLTSRSQLMNDIAKGAFILLCVAGTYKLLFSSPDAQQVLPAPAHVQNAAQSAPQPTPEQSGTASKLSQENLGQLIKERQIAVMAQGKVIFTAGKPSDAPKPAPAPLAPAQVQAPAPQRVVTAPTPVAQTAPGVMAKIGFNNDGTRMPENEKRKQIAEALSRITDNFTINWKAPNEKAAIYVFTDPTCPYCQKLHHAIPELNAAGITVHYLMYPRDMGRGGNGLTPTQENLNNVWCAVDQKAALNDAYAGYKVPAADCASLPPELQRMNSPIAQHFFLGNVFNVQGTPSVFTADGKDLPGFQSAEKLISEVLN